ncbi:MAG: isoprenyl transferase [Clostridia bacterium]
MAWFGQGKGEKKKQAVDMARLPTHIAFIMDGNGRWAKQRFLSRNLGHNEGAKVLKRMVRICGDMGVKHLTFYAFSTENWARPKEEVDTLMGLLLDFLINYEREMEGKDIRIRVIGDVKVLSQEIQNQVKIVHDATCNNKSLEVNVAINYGSRDEILAAARALATKAVEGQLKPDEIDAAVFGAELYTVGTPDPDLFIRTSGEQRLSNFLLWQSAYAELYFTPVLWPDFSDAELYKAIIDYQERDRRFGGR